MYVSIDNWVGIDILEFDRKDTSEGTETHEVSYQPPSFCMWSHCTVKRRLDDEIFEHTMSTFPELAENDHAKLVKIDEEWMKSEGGKKRWRDFMNQWVLLV